MVLTTASRWDAEGHILSISLLNKRVLLRLSDVWAMIMDKWVYTNE